MIIDTKLKNESPIVFPVDKKFKTDYFYPEIAVSVAGEAGVIANILDDRYPVDLLFKKQICRAGLFRLQTVHSNLSD